MKAKRSESKVADTIRRAMQRSKLSRYRIAELSGVTAPALSRFVRGRNMTVGCLEAVAEVLGLEIVVQPRAKKGG